MNTLENWASFLLSIYNGIEKKLKDDVSLFLDEPKDEDRGGSPPCSNDNDEIDHMHETSNNKSSDNNIFDGFSQTQNVMGELHILMDKKEIWHSHSISYANQKDFIMQCFVTGAWTVALLKGCLEVLFHLLWCLGAGNLLEWANVESRCINRGDGKPTENLEKGNDLK